MWVGVCPSVGLLVVVAYYAAVGRRSRREHRRARRRVSRTRGLKLFVCGDGVPVRFSWLFDTRSSSDAASESRAQTSAAEGAAGTYVSFEAYIRSMISLYLSCTKLRLSLNVGVSSSVETEKSRGRIVNFWTYRGGVSRDEDGAADLLGSNCSHGGKISRALGPWPRSSGTRSGRC